jgi:predicted nucleotidyltransferase
VVADLTLRARHLVESDTSIRAVVLFGSLARGRGNPGSDADLLVLLESSPHPRRMDRIPELLRRLAGAPVPLDLHPYTVTELEQRREDGDPFVGLVLSTGTLLAGELP